MGVPDGAGKPCETHFYRTAYDPLTHTSLVTATPRTGRTHQIRAHLAHLGHPVANDPRYLHPPGAAAVAVAGAAGAPSTLATTPSVPTSPAADAAIPPPPPPPLPPSPSPLRLADVAGGDAAAAAGAALGCPVCDAVSPPAGRGWAGCGAGGWGAREIWLWAAEYAAAGGEWRFVAPLPAWAR
ncbi:hypothetical protein I4F81_008774 [Pyropia yezoensis]|uniref:Uncharacterized protein n=1 Tax=Pyropia yezoensis TaxID=2788 RepID=A0ACC3C7G1_PYRYE|nr:hypothetical protein I4F81_008774 [Neopyropia yezoensis]